MLSFNLTLLILISSLWEFCDGTYKALKGDFHGFRDNPLQRGVMVVTMTTNAVSSAGIVTVVVITAAITFFIIFVHLFYYF